MRDMHMLCNLQLNSQRGLILNKFKIYNIVAPYLGCTSLTDT